MTVWKYIKEKWYMFALSALALAFSMAVFRLDEDSVFGNSNTAYILSGVICAFFIYAVVDYIVLRSKVKKMTAFIKNGGVDDVDFFYPSDEIIAGEINSIANEYNRFRSKTAMEAAEETDFITKWIHDIKVPISAMKLLIESQADDKNELLEMELLKIEQSTQKVLYNIKSKSFYDDFKINTISTKSLINASLKQFAVFFAHKKINLKIEGGEFDVLTDSKWSGYIISQFISNAVKYTNEGGEIKVSVGKENGETVITIRNTGEGIEKNDLPGIFSRGYTSSLRNNAYSTGFGLYLSKKLADRLGHKLKAESEKGSYAKFSIYFRDMA